MAERLMALALVACAAGCFAAAIAGSDQSLWLVGTLCLVSVLAVMDKRKEDE